MNGPYDYICYKSVRKKGYGIVNQTIHISKSENNTISKYRFIPGNVDNNLFNVVRLESKIGIIIRKDGPTDELGRPTKQSDIIIFNENQFANTNQYILDNEHLNHPISFSAYSRYVLNAKNNLNTPISLSIDSLLNDIPILFIVSNENELQYIFQTILFILPYFKISNTNLIYQSNFRYEKSIGMYFLKESEIDIAKVTKIAKKKGLKIISDKSSNKLNNWKVKNVTNLLVGKFWDSMEKSIKNEDIENINEFIYIRNMYNQISKYILFNDLQLVMNNYEYLIDMHHNYSKVVDNTFNIMFNKNLIENQSKNISIIIALQNLSDSLKIKPSIFVENYLMKIEKHNLKLLSKK